MQIITTHNNSDFDALSSAIGAKILYPEAEIVIPRQLNPNVRAFLSIHKDIFEFKTIKDIDLKAVSSLVVVDTNRWGRLDGFSDLQERQDIAVAVWDHHPGPGDIDAAWSCCESIGSTTTLLLREIKARNCPLSPVVATLFLTAIYEDTGNLSFGTATAEDAYAVGYLLEHKADLTIANTFLRPAYGEKQKNLLFAMLQQAERVRLNDFVVSFNTIKVQGHLDRLSLVVHMYREILNVDAAFGIFHNVSQDRCMVIGRSTIDAIHVGSILRSMGGGGHPGAGSGMIKGVQPEAVVEWLRELIIGNQVSSVQISDLMSFPVLSAVPDTSMRRISLLLEEKGCTGIPVVEDQKLVGVISRRDFNRVKKQSQLDAPVRAFMSRNVITAHPNHSPMQAAHLMVKHDIGRLPVVDNGRLVGIITRSDVMGYFYDTLPDFAGKDFKQVEM